MAFDNYSRVTTSVTFTNANVSDVTFSDSSPYTATFSYSSISDQLESTLEDKDQLMIWFIFDTDADSATVSDLSDVDAKTLMQIPNDRWTINTSAKTITLLDMAVGNDGTGTASAGGFVRPGISATLSNQTIIVQRSTYQLDELVSWVSGTRITSRQLNLSSTQLLHLIQELNSTLENSTISTLPSEIPTSFSFGNQALSLVNSITSADTNDSSNEKIIMNGGNVGTTSSILEGQDAATAFVKISGQGVLQLLDNNSGTPDATEYVKLDPTVIGSSSNSIEVYDGATKFAVDGTGLITTATGLKFPATQVASSDANTLDDYEEGTFTPAYARASGSATWTYATDGQVGHYTKIGRVVHFQIALLVASVSSSDTNAVTISGLPFTSKNATNFKQGVTITGLVKVDVDGDKVLQGHIAPNSTSITLAYQTDDSAVTNFVSQDLDEADNELLVSGTYIV